MGPESAVTLTALMDATETVMREEGYAAVTSRRVAERAGVNQQTVYYYFQTMDDLLLATYRRRTGQMLEKAEQALACERPLHSLWQSSSDPFEAALSVEYLALANHNELIRRETIEFGDRLRRLKVEALAEHLAPGSPDPDAVTPAGMIVALGFVAHLLGAESALGVRSGHRDVRMLVEWCLRQLEPNGARGRAARRIEEAS
jgi:AcrR family transcriptional regulator